LAEHLTEEDARELFLILQDEFAEDFEIGEDTQDENTASDQSEQGSSTEGTTQTQDNDDLADFSIESMNTTAFPESGLDRKDATTEVKGSLAPDPMELDGMSELSGLDENELERIEDLQSALPGMPIRRIKQVAKAFENTLGYPSLLTLVPILRETLPDRLTLGYLKQMNKRNADFVLKRAEMDGLVDQSLLNAMLQVKTSASSLDEAENFHRHEFRRHNLVSPRVNVATKKAQYCPYSRYLSFFFPETKGVQ
jgi:hypothetical protein